ncbi:hypothetical protein NYA28ABAC_01348 [Salinicola sp. NYA28a]|jgi:hypothetical protein
MRIVRIEETVCVGEIVRIDAIAWIDEIVVPPEFR